MQKEAREAYNQSFTESKYREFLNAFEVDFPGQLEFRVAETPVFVPLALKNKIIQASEEIIASLLSPDFKERTDRAVPEHENVPNENAHTSFLAIDFAVCRNESGELIP